MKNKFYNIITFSSLFLSGDVKLTETSPDYFLEKFEKCFGDKVKIKKIDSISELYTKNLFKPDDYRINTILKFLSEVFIESNNVKKNIKNDNNRYWKALSSITGGFRTVLDNIICDPKTYIRLFNKYFDNFNEIEDDKYTHIHIMVKDSLIDRYFYYYKKQIKYVLVREIIKTL